MEAPQLQRLMPCFLLLITTFFFAASSLATEHEAATSAPGSGLHPVVLLPGYSCSQLDARLTDEYVPPSPGCGARQKQGSEWFRLWENYTAMHKDPALVPCYADQLRLVYDTAAGDYRNVQGVATRVVAFGTTRGFGSDDPARKNTCMDQLVEALEGAGYKEGENLFGAPYDFRHVAAAPGEASAAFSRFVSRLRRLVERANARNGGKPVILVTHSLGGYQAIDFIHRSPLWWRHRYVKHFVMLSIGVGGSPPILQALASDIGRAPSLPDDLVSFNGSTSRSFASLWLAFPSPKVFGDAPLVVTRARNYTAADMPEFLALVGFSGDEVARYLRRALPVTLNFRAPLVPMTCINGVGVPTAERLIYSDDADFVGGAQPDHVVYGDGDGAIGLPTVLALDTVIGDDPEQRHFKSVLIPNVTHTGMVSDDLALKRVVSEILEANKAAP